MLTSIILRVTGCAFTVMLVLVGGMIAITHTRPYADIGVRDLLMPSGCESPCFLGIRPGVTTQAEAVTLLESHAWVASIAHTQLMFEGKRYDFIEVNWKDSAPDVLVNHAPDAGVVFMDGRVLTLYYATGFSQADFALALPLPGGMEVINRSTRKVDVYAYYPALELRIFTGTRCPMTISDLWRDHSTYVIMPLESPFFPQPFAHTLRRPMSPCAA